jgi:hypothetical protein
MATYVAVAAFFCIFAWFKKKKMKFIEFNIRYDAGDSSVMFLRYTFDDDNLALSLSEAGKKKALITHDARRNAQLLIDAYTDILKEK